MPSPFLSRLLAAAAPGRLDPKWALFSANSFIAAMLAIYFAFRLGLERPYWAMLTVYLTAQPFAGAVRSRAVYRLDIAGRLRGAGAGPDPGRSTRVIVGCRYRMGRTLPLYLLAGPHAAQLCFPAGRLHCDDNRVLERPRSGDGICDRAVACRGDPARHRLCDPGAHPAVPARRHYFCAEIPLRRIVGRLRPDHRCALRARRQGTEYGALEACCGHHANRDPVDAPALRHRREQAGPARHRCRAGPARIGLADAAVGGGRTRRLGRAALGRVEPPAV
ncbi:FUSC family protein [Bradyrhizobium sp. 136]|nr:FUSC family protein [Bradyrhizobium sp. 136]